MDPTESGPFREIDGSTFHGQLRKLLGKRVKIIWLCTEAWIGILKEIGLDWIRVENELDPFTIIPISGIRMIHELLPKKEPA